MMKRSKKIVLVSHCILNINSKVEGLATSKACVREVIDYLYDNDYGIIQLQCPELTCMGIKRWGQSINQYNNPFYEEHCTKLAEDVIKSVRNYITNGYEVKYVIGIDKSPTCGVNLTCYGNAGGENLDFDGYETREGQGVFMDTLMKENEKYNLGLEFVGIDEEDPIKSMKDLKMIITD